MRSPRVHSTQRARPSKLSQDVMEADASCNDKTKTLTGAKLPSGARRWQRDASPAPSPPGGRPEPARLRPRITAAAHHRIPPSITASLLPSPPPSFHHRLLPSAREHSRTQHRCLRRHPERAKLLPLPSRHQLSDFRGRRDRGTAALAPSNHGPQPLFSKASLLRFPRRCPNEGAAQAAL